MYEFCSAALPWVALSVVTAILLAFRRRVTENRLACLCLGFFGGIVIASVLKINPLYGMPFGLLAGLLLPGKRTGTATEK